jgi:hypothetical protein
MPKIKVSTDEVEHAAKQVQQAGATTREAADHLAGGRMSDPGFQTAGAVARFCSAWTSGLTAFAKACDSVSGRLSATSTVYEVTERNLSEEY